MRSNRLLHARRNYSSYQKNSVQRLKGAVPLMISEKSEEIEIVLFEHYSEIQKHRHHGGTRHTFHLTYIRKLYFLFAKLVALLICDD